jgi:hypothetical protein
MRLTITEFHDTRMAVTQQPLVGSVDAPPMFDQTYPALDVATKPAPATVAANTEQHVYGVAR